MSNINVAESVLSGVADDMGGELIRDANQIQCFVALDMNADPLRIEKAPSISVIYFDRSDWNSDPSTLSFFVQLNIPKVVFPITGKWTEQYAVHASEGIEMVARMLFKLADTGFDVIVNQDEVVLYGEAKGGWDYRYKVGDPSFVKNTIQDICDNIEGLDAFIQGEFDDYAPFEKIKLREAGQ